MNLAQQGRLKSIACLSLRHLCPRMLPPLFIITLLLWERKGYRLFQSVPNEEWCIPFRYKNADDSGNEDSKKIVEVLMISSTSGPGLLFPKGGWENDETVEQAAVREAVEEAGVRGELMDLLGYYHFKSKTHQDEFCPEGLCKAAMFALFVNEELLSWPEQSTRTRSWVTIPAAVESCRHPWMRKALEDGFCKWHEDKMMSMKEYHDDEN